MELDNLKIGQDVYYIDKSDGPGLVMYVQGTLLAVKESTVTLEITDSGWLVDRGDEAPLETDIPLPRKGTTFDFKVDNRLTFVATPDEFKEVEKQFKVTPAPVEIAQRYPDVPIADRRLNPSYDQKKKQEAQEEAERERVKEEERLENFPPEEGAPNYEDEEEAGEGLQLVASLDSWSRNPEVNIHWPKGFTREQMAELENIYEKIPKGSVNKSVPWGMTREGPGHAEPVVTIPGGKGAGVMPYLRQFTDERLKGKHQGIQEEFELAGQAVQAAKEEEAAARAKWDAGKGEEGLHDWKTKQKKLQRAIADFKQVNKRLQRLLTRPPEAGKRTPANTFTQTPGHRAPHDTEMRGRAGLREELRQLSDKYRKTTGLLEGIKVKEDIAALSARELDIILNLRQNRLKKKPTEKIENALRRLKYQEYKEKPYLWSTSRSKEGENPQISERDRVLQASTFSEKPFAQKVGTERTFFDLTPEEINYFVKKDVEKHGPLSPETRDKLAWKYANEYVQLIDKRVGWKDLSDEIQDYVRAQYGIVISKERADRLEKEVSSKAKEIVARGRDAVTGQIVEKTIPAGEIHRDVINRTKQYFGKQAQWLGDIQRQRERDLAAEKAKARRLLTEKGEDKVISDQKYKESILALFHKYAKTSHETGTEKAIPNRYEVEHGHRAYEEKLAEADEIQSEITKLKEDLAKLQGQRRASYVPYKRASEDLELKQDDIGLTGAANNISEEIKKQVSRREVLLNFYKDREDWKEKVQKGVQAIDNNIVRLEQERTKLFTNVEPPEVAKDLRRLDQAVKAELNKWLKIEHATDVEVEAFHVKLDEVHKRKSKLEEEIGPLKEKEK